MPPRDADTLDVFAWNSHQGRPWGELVAVLDEQVVEGRPHAIVLNEVRRHWAQLAMWAKRNGFDIFQEKPDAENLERGSTALLLDRRTGGGIEFLSHRVVVMRLAWMVFSHRRRRQPRRYERVRFRTHGGVWKVTASHWPTNGFDGGNRVAFAESVTRAVATFRLSRPGVAVLDIGDHNEKVQRLRRWAKALGFRVAGHGPDSVIALRADVTAQTLGKFNSDHHAMRYRITRKES